MPEHAFIAADKADPAALHAAFTAAFADYLIGPFTLPLAQWPQFTGRQGVDLGLSRVALQGGGPTAFALVAPRPRLRIWRLATMGAVPAARGSGSAAALLDDFIARAGEAGMRQVELECFAQNGRALRLYRSRGFEPVHELHGHVREPQPEPPDAPEVLQPPAHVNLERAFSWLDRVELARGDLPLQVTPASLAALPVELTGWRIGDAQVVFSKGEGLLTLHSLVDEGATQNDALALARMLVRAHGERRIVVPQLQRADLGGDALLEVGFVRQPLHQLLMRRKL